MGMINARALAAAVEQPPLVFCMYSAVLCVRVSRGDSCLSLTSVYPGLLLCVPGLVISPGGTSRCDGMLFPKKERLKLQYNSVFLSLTHSQRQRSTRSSII